MRSGFFETEPDCFSIQSAQISRRFGRSVELYVSGFMLCEISKNTLCHRGINRCRDASKIFFVVTESNNIDFG